MNKRLDKRRKRPVSSKKERVRLSQPDMRTPEQRQAAREASQVLTGRRNGPRALYSTPVKPEAGS